MSPRRRPPRPRALLVGLALAVVCAGCSAPGGGAATSNDAACAAVLPLAREVVHGQGTLTLIRRINRDDADTLSREAGVAPPPPPPGPRPPKPPPTDTPAGPPAPKTCLVVYQGSYPPGAIPQASPPAVGGQYALIVLRVRHPALDRVLVTDQLPADTTPRHWWQTIF